MSRRRDLEDHRHSLGEIREIMNSMKTLAYMETRKLTRFLPAQQAVVDSIEQAAADFLAFHPDIRPAPGQQAAAFILVGSERGFCGDFNQAVVQRLAGALPEPAVDQVHLLTVGHKLHPLFEGDGRMAASVDGANVVEEVSAVLHQVVDALAKLQAAQSDLNVYALAHGDDDVVIHTLLPPFQSQSLQPPLHAQPPLLNLSPQTFLLDLTDHYLFAVLHQILYASLMAENYRRVAHLEGAVRHLDRESADLRQRCNALRQEEIIEEIEVILLSAASLDDGPDARRV